MKNKIKILLSIISICFVACIPASDKNIKLIPLKDNTQSLIKDKKDTRLFRYKDRIKLRELSIPLYYVETIIKCYA